MQDNIKKFLSSQTKRNKDFEKIGLPEKNNQIMMVSDVNFNMLTFLMYIIKEKNHVDELIMSFYSFSKKPLDYIDYLMSQNVIDKLIFQTSDLRKYGSDSNVMAKIKQMAEKYGLNRVTGSYVNTHAKIMLVKTQEYFYCVEGSGNISEKDTGIEQYLIDNNEDLYNFHKDWILNNSWVENAL